MTRETQRSATVGENIHRYKKKRDLLDNAGWRHSWEIFLIMLDFGFQRLLLKFK